MRDYKEERTSLSSVSVKTRGRRNFLMGTVRMRAKGNARDALDDLIAHMAVSRITCTSVYMWILRVGTCETTHKACGLKETCFNVPVVNIWRQAPKVAVCTQIVRVKNHIICGFVKLFRCTNNVTQSAFKV